MLSAVVPHLTAALARYRSALLSLVGACAGVWSEVGCYRSGMPPKNSKKASGTPAPSWWVGLVCEMWAAQGKPRLRAAFYRHVVECLDEIYGGVGEAGVPGYSCWGTKGVLRVLSTDNARDCAGGTDALFNDILVKLNWTVQRAREDSSVEVMCLGDDESIAEHMLRLWEVRRGGGQMLAYDPVSCAYIVSE